MARFNVKTFRDLLSDYVIERDPKMKVVKGRMDDMPDRLIAVRRGTGRGDVMDGLYEAVSWSVESRGNTMDIDDSERVADMVDDIILDYFNNLFYRECHILSAEWTGSGPQQQTLNDPQSRYSYVCNYTIVSSRE